MGEVCSNTLRKQAGYRVQRVIALHRARFKIRACKIPGSSLASAHMNRPVLTKDPAAVEAAVQAIYCAVFPNGDLKFIPRVFNWAKQCFTGQCPNYRAVDSPYHDFEHTLQGTLCMARLLGRRHLAGAQPPLSEHTFQLGILAILLHDTGYLKKKDDVSGTGAKYTVTHVSRSKDFAAEFLRDRGFNPTDIKAVQNMISCTGVDSALSEIPFQNEEERITGHALGTADLLGQMAADDYVEELPILYAEFEEAAKFSHDDHSFVALFSSVEDLTQKTPGFWRNYVIPKLDRDFEGLYRFLADPYPNGQNSYVQRIEANIAKIKV
jgi:hypothetical protein